MATGNETMELCSADILRMRTSGIPTPIKDAVIKWYKEHHCANGDDYYVSIPSKHRAQFVVGFVNDYPLQHGSGKSIALTDEQFTEATGIRVRRKLLTALSEDKR